MIFIYSATNNFILPRQVCHFIINIFFSIVAIIHMSKSMYISYILLLIYFFSYRFIIPTLTIPHLDTHLLLLCYCVMRPYTEGRLDHYLIGIPRELSEIRTQPWLCKGSLT